MPPPRATGSPRLRPRASAPMIPPARMPLYFAFGSNLDADQMGERCPGAHARFAARLPEHRIGFTYPSRRWGGGAADILPAAGQSVWGLVWELGEDDLSR